jgi:hypothetical protein
MRKVSYVSVYEENLANRVLVFDVFGLDGVCARIEQAL